MTMTHPTLDTDEIRDLNADFESAQPTDILSWAAKKFGHGLAVTSSFGDPILAHLAWTTIPGIEVSLIDTQYLFAETIWYAKHLADRTGGNLRILTPASDVGRDDLWMRDTDLCCGVRKVAPLEHMLANRSAWVTGLRRDDGPTRAQTPIVFHDVLRDVIKVNPIANWTDADVASYVLDNDLPQHPLQLVAGRKRRQRGVRNRHRTLTTSVRSASASACLPARESACAAIIASSTPIGTPSSRGTPQRAASRLRIRGRLRS